METTDKPTILVLSRQNLPVLEVITTVVFEKVTKGGLRRFRLENTVPEGILIATGSEVSLAIQVQKNLREQGQDFHCVVFLLSFYLFEQQTPAYQKAVLSKAVTKREPVEVAATFGWERYFESAVKVIGIDHFGASAPGDRILREFGFTIENVVVICNRL